MEDVTDEYRARLENIFYTYVIRIICVVGIFGNIAILIVLSRRGTKETAFVYIRALAAVDFVISLVMSGMCYVRGSGVDAMKASSTQQYFGRLYEGFIYLPIANAAQMANLFITIAMAVHRVASVVKIHTGTLDIYSLRINVGKSRLFAKRVVAIILIFSAAINTSRFFFNTIDKIPVTPPAVAVAGNQAAYHPVSTAALESPAGTNDSAVLVGAVAQKDRRHLQFDDTRVDNGWMPVTTVNWTSEHSVATRDDDEDVRYVLSTTTFHNMIHEYFMIALSTLHFCELLTLTTVNVILIGILRRSKNQRKNLIRSEVQHRKKTDDVTRMLVVTVIVHIVCHLLSPFSVDPIARYVFGESYVLTNTYKVQRVFNNALTLTSHAVTFFLYLVSAKFRNQVKRTWACFIHGLRIRVPAQSSFSADSGSKYSWTPSYAKGGASPIMARQHSTTTIRFL